MKSTIWRDTVRFMFGFVLGLAIVWLVTRAVDRSARSARVAQVTQEVPQTRDFALWDSMELTPNGSFGFYTGYGETSITLYQPEKLTITCKPKPTTLQALPMGNFKECPEGTVCTDPQPSAQ